jgi:alginate O-acetyltransferase complex protein AlgI
LLFQSAEYLLFLPICVFIFWNLPSRWRIHFLMLASYVFYAVWSVPYAVMMFVLVLFNWFAATFAVSHPSQRNRVIVGAIVADLAILAVFKYLNFLIQNASGVASATAGQAMIFPRLDIVLPLGISFFTFEFIHFLVDVRRGAMPKMRFSEFHVFASFFPTQIAGPIKRFQDFLPQIGAVQALTIATASEAAEWIVIGLFKKAVLADSLAYIVDTGFVSTSRLTTVDAWISALAFAFQIYFDFSGYTDIARGSALLFGFRIPLNFAQPYLAGDVSNFWQRWHISLSTWLRDYLFIPLGGSRGARAQTARNLMITMVLGGLWHGAGWQFLVWGAYWGIVLVLYHQWLRVREHAPNWLAALTRVRPIAIAATFLVVLIGWCFFRAPPGEALEVISAMLLPEWGTSVFPRRSMLFVAVVVIGYFLLAGLGNRLGGIWQETPAPVRALVLAILVLVFVVAAPSGVRTFIYFQF